MGKYLEDSEIENLVIILASAFINDETLSTALEESVTKEEFELFRKLQEKMPESLV